MTERKEITTQQLLQKSLNIAIVLIPIAIGVYFALEINRLEDTEKRKVEIICFSPENCAIKLDNQIYLIDDVISLDETIPERFKLTPVQKKDRFKPVQPNLTREESDVSKPEEE